MATEGIQVQTTETPLVIKLTAPSLDRSRGSVAYHWTISDGTQATTHQPVATLTFPSAGEYEVQLRITGKKSASYSVTVVVPEPPEAAFAFEHSGRKVTFDASDSRGGDAEIKQYLWHFGDGTEDSLAHPVTKHEFSEDGKFEVVLTIAADNGIKSTLRRKVAVPGKDPPDPTFHVDVESGPAPLTVTFRVVNPGPGVDYRWDFGDRTPQKSGPEVAHEFQRPDEFTVTLAATHENGRRSTFSKTINVFGETAMPHKPIIFTDIRDQEAAERRRLENRAFELGQAKAKAPNEKLPPQLEDELKELLQILRASNPLDENGQPRIPDENADPLFRGIRETLKKICPCDWEPQPVADVVGATARKFVHLTGKLPSQVGEPSENLTSAESSLAAVFGILTLDHSGPGQPIGSRPGFDSRFEKLVSVAQGEYTSAFELFGAVFNVLKSQGAKNDGYYVQANQVVSVVRSLKLDGVTADDDRLALKITFALAKADGASDGGSVAAINIDLPDLEDAGYTDVGIELNNLYAIQALYFAASLEELKVFQVVDRLVEQFQQGYLPLGRGRAGELLYKYWKSGYERLSEMERRNLYSRCFGIPGGAAEQGNPNRNFENLWMRFLSAVSSFVRQTQVDSLFTKRIPMAVGQEQVRKSGRDLAANLSLHGYGIAFFAATELQNQINEMIELLSDDEVKLSYGARDMWQVIDQVATLELGGARNSIRYRTMANSGAVVIRWLAERRKDLVSIGTQVIDPGQVRDFNPRARNVKPTVNPTDYDLVNACEQWLAVNGIPDQEVEDFAQPSESPLTTSRPVQVPGAVQDALSAAGIQFGDNRLAGMNPTSNGNGRTYHNYQN